MDLFEAIGQRYSYRGAFTQQAVPREHIEKILDAGIRAPSGHNYQTTRFIAVADPTLREKLHEIIGTKGTASAPVIILVLSSAEKMENGVDFELVDYSAATENILLAVTALGYATVWIDGKLTYEDRAARIARLLDVPEGYTVRVALPVGVPEAPGAQREKKPFDERAQIV